MQRRSTVSNLTNFTQFVSTILDSGGQVDVVYTDFAKAFDKVDHDILLSKLESSGLSYNLVQFFCSYLKNRKQFVVFNGAKSHEFDVLSGVPQGSNLGPLLFLIFINNICVCIRNSNFLLFADDLKIFRVIKQLSDADELQDDLNSLYDWTVENQLYFNINKCQFMSFTKKKTSINYSYTINDTNLKKVNEVKDLGVFFCPDLSFGSHIKMISKKAFQNLGFVIRNSFELNNPDVISKLYFSYTRSILEYNALVWDPSAKNLKSILEKVQNKFLRYLYWKINRLYPFDKSQKMLLNELQFNSLEHRRKKQSLIYLHRLINGQTDNAWLLERVLFYVPAVRSRQKRIFFVPRVNTVQHSNCPLHRICKSYNNFSNQLDIFSTSISSFSYQLTNSLPT